MNESLKDFNKWSEVTRGLYRYAISAGACYEIHILRHVKDTDILTARANAYIVGDWHSKDGDFFERERLLSEQPVFECVKKAVDDYKENCED